MKSYDEFQKFVAETLTGLTGIEYEVETNLDDDGGCYFSNLQDAYNYLLSTLKKQTDTKFFECGDFEKINYIRVAIHFVAYDADIIPLVGYIRKSDNEFHETELI